jgi:hypothetical protein
VHADTLAVAGELETALAWASFIGDADVHQADRLFGRAAAGSCNSCDAHAYRGARSFADSLG